MSVVNTLSSWLTFASVLRASMKFLMTWKVFCYKYHRTTHQIPCLNEPGRDKSKQYAPQEPLYHLSWEERRCNPLYKSRTQREWLVNDSTERIHTGMTDKESKLMLIGAALRDLSEGSNAVEGLLLNTSPSKEASKHTHKISIHIWWYQKYSSNLLEQELYHRLQE